MDEGKRRVKAVFGTREISEDPAFERDFSVYIRNAFSSEEVCAVFDRFRDGETRLDFLMRRIILKALVKYLGNDVTVSPGFFIRHPETVELGDGVFIGNNTFIQGRYDGYCQIGNRVWIGPGSYFDARALVIEDFVGWGPGAKVLGSEHTGYPVDIPVIQTDLVVRPVRICKGSDIGTNAVLLPGVTIGAGALVGAGAVVTSDVEPNTVVAGVPARFLKKRE
jgi:acetyltransferase-like isoleucine patch superfamily enzyme